MVSSANVHICADCFEFSTYQVTSEGCVILGNGLVAHLLGQGRIDLKMASKKTPTHSRPSDAPDIRRNLISGLLLIQSGYKIALETNRKRFVFGGLFKLNVCEHSILPFNKSYLYSSSLVVLNVESCETWYGRLGHVNFGTIRRLMNFNFILNPDLIPKSNID